MTEFLHNWTQGALATGLRLLVILLVTLVLIRIVKKLTNRLIAVAVTDSRAARVREQQTRTLAALVMNITTVVLILVAMLTALPLFGVSSAPLAAAAGVIAVAAGLGAQHLVRDILSGFVVLMEDQFNVGDTIRAGDATGRVELITLRRTLLRGPDGALITIPNGDMRRVENLSRDWSLVYVDVPLEAKERVEQAMEVLEGVAADLRTDPAWSPVLLDGPRLLGVEGFEPGKVTVRLQMRCEPTRQSEAARELRRRIRAQFEKMGMTFSPEDPARSGVAQEPGQPFRRSALNESAQD